MFVWVYQCVLEAELKTGILHSNMLDAIFCNVPVSNTEFCAFREGSNLETEFKDIALATVAHSYHLELCWSSDVGIIYIMLHVGLSQNLTEGSDIC